MGASPEIFAEVFGKDEHFFPVMVVKLTGYNPEASRAHLYYNRETICLRKRST